MEVVRLIQSLERQTHSPAPTVSRTPEKSVIHLIEAHDWMGPESRDSQADPKDLVIRTDSTFR